MENKDKIKNYYSLEKNVSQNLRIFQNSNFDKNKYDQKDLEVLFNFLSYNTDEEMVCFICSTINLYKSSIYHIHEQIEEENKKKLVEKIKAIYSQKKEPIIFRELTEYNFKKMCENKKEDKSFNQNIENNLSDYLFLDKLIENKEKNNNMNLNNEKCDGNRNNNNGLYIKKKYNINYYFKSDNNLKKNEVEKKNEKLNIKAPPYSPKNKKEMRINKFINMIKSKKLVSDFLKEHFSKTNPEINFGINQNDINDISEEYKIKLITLLCILFPFFHPPKKTEYIEIIEKLFPNSQNLNVNLLLNNQSKKYSSFLHDIVKKQNQTFNIMDYVPFKSKFDLIECYKLIFIVKNLKIEKKGLKKFCLKIGFLCYLSLKYYNCDKIFHETEEILDFFYNLYFIQQFYENVYPNQFNEENYLKYNTDINDFYFKDLYPKPINDNFIGLGDLFSNEEIHLFEQTLGSIKKLYNAKNIILLKDLKIDCIDNLFSTNILELQTIKNKYITKNPIQYKKNLIVLEKEIQKIINGKSNFSLEGEKKSILQNHKINENVKTIFIKFSNNLRKQFSKYKFNLYPYGSITEFLSSKKSDLDIYLEIKDLKNRPKNSIDFLKELYTYLSDKYKSKLILSKRICLFKLNYKELDIDLSVLGFSPYLHSSIFRTYSLMDSRFPILVFIIKYLVNELGIKYDNNQENNNGYLNSFSWVLLIISFLQDIVNPPILPKLFEKCNFVKTIMYYRDSNNKKKNYDFNDFLNRIQMENVKIPKFNSEEYKKIYNDFHKENKNNLSVSELLLSFLEFIIYFFKFDVLYDNFSFNGKEGIVNISNIINNEEPEYIQYYLNKYLSLQNKNSKEKDGVFLFRDPFDSHYNPGQTFKTKDIDVFFQRLKFAYKTLIKTGSINELINQLNEKNNE